MWVKLAIISFLALCLLPDTTVSFTQGICDYCNPSCAVTIGNTERRLDFFKGFLYYFERDNIQHTWAEGSAACSSIFSKTRWPGATGSLASFHSVEEYNFIASSVKKTSRRYISAIGGIRIVGNNKVWKWTDGTPLNMTLINLLWRKGEPNFYGKVERVLEIWTGKLNDVSADGKRGAYTCKIPCTRAKELPDQCKPGNYKTLSDASRKANNPLKGRATCDHYPSASPNWRGPGWYKFANPAGTQIATSPPRVNTCGANLPGYMTTRFPREIGQTHHARFCFSWKGNTCAYRNYGKVTKCGEGDFVYKLPNVPICYARYCAAPTAA